MALTYSQMIDLGAQAPEFDLPVSNPATVGSETLNLMRASYGKPLAIVFMCNHCPFVVHIEDALVDAAQVCSERGVNLVGISSNDALQYPQDSFEAMGQRAQNKKYPFPYLYDESQAVARAYGAECTPDFFLYDENLRLAYRGRFDESRPGIGHATGEEFLQAVDELLTLGVVTMPQRPSMGCNIKWK